VASVVGPIGGDEKEKEKENSVSVVVSGNQQPTATSLDNALGLYERSLFSKGRIGRCPASARFSSVIATTLARCFAETGPDGIAVSAMPPGGEEQVVCGW
jgi:hypothetical protein